MLALGVFLYILTSGAPVRAQISETTSTLKLDSTSPRKSNKDHLLLKTGLYFKTLNGTGPQAGSSNSDRVQISGLQSILTYNHELSDWLRLDLEVGAQVESGSTRSIVSSEFSQSGFFLNHTEATLKPLPHVAVGVGALNQRHLENQLLVREISFPGAEQVFTFDENPKAPWNAKFVLQETTPNSNSVGTLSDQPEPFSQLFTQTVFIYGRPTDRVDGHLRFTRFQFGTLPAAVAADSQVFGNSTTGSPPNAQFIYAYRGFEGGGELNYHGSGQLELAAGGGYLINTSAPNGQNQGEIFYLQGKHPVAPKVEVLARASYFINQADTSPSAYNSRMMGHNNRKGYMAEVSARFQDLGFAVNGRFVDSDVVQPRPYQQDFQYVFLSLEFLNDIL